MWSLESHQIGLGFSGPQVLFDGGNERRVCFWLDSRCGDVPLKEEVPSLFAIAASKEAWVGEAWYGLVEGGSFLVF